MFILHFKRDSPFLKETKVWQREGKGCIHKNVVKRRKNDYKIEDKKNLGLGKVCLQLANKKIFQSLNYYVKKQLFFVSCFTKCNEQYKVFSLPTILMRMNNSLLLIPPLIQISQLYFNIT